MCAAGVSWTTLIIVMTLLLLVVLWVWFEYETFNLKERTRLENESRLYASLSKAALNALYKVGRGS